MFPACMLSPMDFSLTGEDVEALRHLASIDPLEARHYLQDRPELAKRMASWPPEIRMEVCRIIYRSFGDDRQNGMQARRHLGSNLVDLLAGED